MVCDKCEKKLSKVIVPDKWRTGARNTAGGADGGRQVVTTTNNKISLKGKIKRRKDGSSSKSRFSPFDKNCRICKDQIPRDTYYCQPCAYKKGICTMCGRKVLNTKDYKMSA